MSFVWLGYRGSSYPLGVYVDAARGCSGFFEGAFIRVVRPLEEGSFSASVSGLRLRSNFLRGVVVLVFGGQLPVEVWIPLYLWGEA